MKIGINPIQTADRGRVANRRVLMWAHAILAFATMTLYISHLDLSEFNYTRNGAGFDVIMMSVPVLIPYGVSARYSWKVATDCRKIAIQFILVLIAGSALMGSFIAGLFGSVEIPTFIELLILQAGVYVWAAELILNVV